MVKTVFREKNYIIKTINAENIYSKYCLFYIKHKEKDKKILKMKARINDIW